MTRYYKDIGLATWGSWPRRDRSIPVALGFETLAMKDAELFVLILHPRERELDHVRVKLKGADDDWLGCFDEHVLGHAWRIGLPTILQPADNSPAHKISRYGYQQYRDGLWVNDAYKIVRLCDVKAKG